MTRLSARIATYGHRGLMRWMAMVRTWALPVVLLAVLASAASLYLTATRLTISTSVSGMLSADLPFRRNARAVDAAFPQRDDTLTVVVEAPSAEAASAAARRMAAAMRTRPQDFSSVYYPQNDPFFRRHGLLYLDLDDLQRLADRLAEAQPLLASLHADPSLRGLAKVLQPLLEDPSREAAALAPALEAIAASAEAARDGTPPPLSWRALTLGTESDETPHRAFLIVQPMLDFAGFSPAGAAMRAVRESAEALDGPGLSDVAARMTGELAMRHDELRGLKENMGLVSLVSLTLVVALLAIGLGSLRLIVATVTTLLIGLSATAGFATLAIGELNIISVAFAVLFIGLSVDFGIHFALRFREEAVRGHGPDIALARAAAGVGGALCLAALAAAIGFFSFLPTSYRGLSELGLISGVGMFIALFCNLTVLPALLSLAPGRWGNGAEAADGRARPGAWVSGFLHQRPRTVLAVSLLLALGAAAVAPMARFDDDPLNLRDPESESVAVLRDLIEDPRFEPYAAVVLADNLSAATGLAAELETLAEVAEAKTLRDAVPAQQDDKILVIEHMSFFLAPLLLPQSPEPPAGAAERQRAAAALRRHATVLAGATGDARLAAAVERLAAALAPLETDAERLAGLESAVFAWLPDLIGDLGESLLAEPFSIEDLPKDFRSRWLAADGRALIEIVPAEDLRGQDARRRFVAAVQSVTRAASGPPVIITEAGRAVIGAYQMAAVIAVTAICALLIVLLRRVATVLLVLAPLCLAALLTVAATVIFDLPFNFANVIVLPLVFGLGVAGGLHIVLRARQAGADRLLETSTPRAVLFSALTTVGSFGALALSSHRGTASMGLLLTIAIGLTMLSTLVVLPVLLSSVARWRDRRTRTN
ncbi:MAG: MMPL family transporter [Kiloniellales bacterium]